MNLHQKMSLFQKNFTTIGVSFDGSTKVYTYKAPSDVELKVDDHVLVWANQDFKVVRVVRVDETPRLDYSASAKFTWIVQKVDTSRYKAIQEQERAFITILAELERKQTEERIRQELIATLPGSDSQQLIEAVKALNEV
jgi:hypothetical protein